MKKNPYRFYFILSLILFFVLLFFLPPAFAKSDSLGLFVSIVFFAVGVFAAVMFIIMRNHGKHSETKTTEPAVPASDPVTSADAAPRIETVSFDVEHVTSKNADGSKRQAILKRIYKLSQKSDVESLLAMPSCVLYPRAHGESVAYVVYLDDERIGDAPPDVCPVLREYIDTGKLLAVNYEIDLGGYDDEIDDLVYQCSVSVRFEFANR